MWKWTDVGGFGIHHRDNGMPSDGKSVRGCIPHPSSCFTSLISWMCLSLAKPTQNQRAKNPIDAVRVAEPSRPHSSMDGVRHWIWGTNKRCPAHSPTSPLSHSLTKPGFIFIFFLVLPRIIFLICLFHADFLSFLTLREQGPHQSCSSFYL